MARDLKLQVRRWLWVKNLRKVASTGLLTIAALYHYLAHMVSPVPGQYSSLILLPVTLLISSGCTFVANGLERKLRTYPEFDAWFGGLQELRRTLNSVLVTGVIAIVATIWIIDYGIEVKNVPILTQVIIAFVATLWIGTLFDICRPRKLPE